MLIVDIEMKLRVSSEERRIEILWSVQTPSLHAVANGHSGEGIFENFTPKLQLPAVHIATSELRTLQSNRKKKIHSSGQELKFTYSP